MPQTNNESEAKIPAKRRKSPRRRWKRVLLLLVLMTLLILRVERNVTDVVLTLSQATARSLAIQALNEAASEMLGLGVHYADLMTVEKDEQGQVCLIQANTPEMNRLAAQASLLAQERLTAMGQKTVVVPLGSAIGLTLLAGAGPGIAVQILPVKGDAAALGGQQAGDGVQHRGFPGAVGADQGDDLAVGYPKADAAQRLDAAVRHTQILNLQHLLPPPSMRR